MKNIFKTVVVALIMTLFLTGSSADARMRPAGEEVKSETPAVEEEPTAADIAKMQASSPSKSWFAEHQLENGSWSFDHGAADACGGKCQNPGEYKNAVNTATALGVLSFLGAGITHKHGMTASKQTVEKGLNFLLCRQKEDGSFCEEDTGMVGHALATLCLAEAFGMTRDKKFREPAQKAIDFIVKSQNRDGSWGKEPKKPGNTLVTAWQIMALKSGYMAYLKVPHETPKKAMEFFDSVQKDGGSRYMLTADAKEPDATSTVAGLLCRMYYGWGKDTPALETAVRQILSNGPSETNLLYNYFATNILMHYGGEAWKTWQTAMNKQLVETQVTDKDSHECGSWYNPSATGLEGGGRLAQTAISFMTLHTYYRYQPIYKKASVEEGFLKI